MKRALAFVAAVGAAAASSAAQPASGPACSAPPPTQLTVLHVGSGILRPGASACFGIELERGAFVRIAVSSEAGYLRARAFRPGERAAFQTTYAWSFFASLPLSFEASAAGTFIIELTAVEAPQLTAPVPYRVQLADHISPAAQSIRRAEVRNDPRVAWLADNAVRIRSIEPDDEDYSDLQFLRADLQGVRVVMLGEPDHGGGSDIKAKTRLIKFLHREMGFDVLVFESGLLPTALAWQALQTEEDPRTAFLKGVFGVLGRSEQAGPLIAHLHASARSPRPLEMAGTDSQFSGTARASIVPELLAFVKRAGLKTPLSSEDDPAIRLLSGLIAGRFGPKGEPIPGAAQQAAAVAALQAASRQADALGTRDGAFWAQVLRSTAVQVGLVLDNLRDPDDATEAYGRGRDRQMAANLVWLANEYYRGRKIVVSAHTFHAMRDPFITDVGKRQGMTMGRGVWDALGAESFSIGLTSYGGTTHWVTQPDGVDQDLIPDQHDGPEFEELMDAAGRTVAYVNLRRARAAGAWPGGTFTANALYLMPETAVWSGALDALLFIRTQEPRRRSREPR